MTKFVSALFAAGAAGWMIVGSTTGAKARETYPGCCGPLPATINYRTMQPQRFMTRYHDVAVYNRVNRIQRVVDVTRIRPIVRIHEITRIYHHTIVRPIDTYEYAAPVFPVAQALPVVQPLASEYAAQQLPSINYVYPSVGYRPGCGCTW